MPNVSDDFVAIATKVCPVCGVNHTHNTELLISKNLKPVGDKTFTGEGLCEEHDRLNKDGFLALVAIDEEKSTMDADGNYNRKDAYRTGSILHIKREVFDNMFDAKVDSKLYMVFVSEELVEILNKMNEKAE